MCILKVTTISTGSQAGNCFLAQSRETKVLLDIGITYKKLRQSLGFDMGGITAALITHEHSDHIKGAEQAAKAGIDIYASAGTIKKAGLCGHRVHAVKPKSFYEIGCFDCMPFSVEHDAAEPVGFVLTDYRAEERLVYATDTMIVRFKIPGVTHWVIECNYDEVSLMRSVEQGYIRPEHAARIHSTHMSLGNLKKLFKQNDMTSAKQIILMHLSETNAHAEQMQAEIQNEYPSVEVIIAGREKGEEHGTGRGLFRSWR